MSTITQILGTDNITDSRAVINTNFSNLNTNKAEIAYVDNQTYDAYINALTESKSYTDDGLALKVDKEVGKGLSTNDYTSIEKTKLAGIEAGAEVNTLNDVIAGTNITIDKTDPLNPVISSTGGGGLAVDSVNGQTGVVVLDTDDITEGTTNKYLSSTDKTDLTDGGDTTLHTHDGRYYTETESDLRYEPIKGSDDNYVTDAEKIVIGNTSGTNTGDQDLSGYTPTSRTLTINGTTYDLSANRSWTIASGGLTYSAINSSGAITNGNYYGVTCSDNIILTLADGTSSGQNLSINKLDNTPYTITIVGNIEYETSIVMDTQYESLDLFWNGTYYLIK